MNVLSFLEKVFKEDKNEEVDLSDNKKKVEEIEFLSNYLFLKKDIIEVFFLFLNDVRSKSKKIKQISLMPSYQVFKAKVQNYTEKKDSIEIEIETRERMGIVLGDLATEAWDKDRRKAPKIILTEDDFQEIKMLIRENSSNIHIARLVLQPLSDRYHELKLK